MGLLDDDALRAPLLPLDVAPRERLHGILRALGMLDGGGRERLGAPVAAAGTAGAAA
jgi:hypothetical protein